MKRAGLVAWICLVGFAALAPARAEVIESGPVTQGFEVRLGGFFPSGGGAFWDGTEQAFTLDQSDFNSAVWGFSYVAGVNNNLEVGFNLEFFDSTVRSSYQNWTDEDGFLILHDTRLELMPVTFDVRFLPAGRFQYRGHGERTYRLRRPVPYLGAGLGVNFWEYTEQGDFVDFATETVFYGHFKDSGIAFEAHVLAGVEVPLWPTAFLDFGAKYSVSECTPGGDFSGLGKLELDGLSLYAGWAVRF